MRTGEVFALTWDDVDLENRIIKIIKNKRVLYQQTLSAPTKLFKIKMAPRRGLEPPAYRLTAECSTIELSRNIII